MQKSKGYTGDLNIYDIPAARLFEYKRMCAHAQSESDPDINALIMHRRLNKTLRPTL